MCWAPKVLLLTNVPTFSSRFIEGRLGAQDVPCASYEHVAHLHSLSDIG